MTCSIFSGDIRRLGFIFALFLLTQPLVSAFSPSTPDENRAEPSLRLLSLCKTSSGNGPDECFLWRFTDKNHATNLNPAAPATLVLQHFDGSRLEFTTTGVDGRSISYTGTRKGRIFHGTLSEGPAGKNKGEWVASSVNVPPDVFNPVTRHTHSIYVACEGGSVVNIISETQRSSKTPDLLGIITGLVVAPDGRRAYASTADKNIFVIDDASGEVVKTFDLTKTPMPHGISGLAISADGSQLYGDGNEHVPPGQWDAVTGAVNTTTGITTLMHTPPYIGQVSAVVGMGTKFYAFVHSDDDREFEWDLRSLSSNALLAPSGDSRSLSAFPDGRHIYVWGRVYDTASRKLSPKMFEGENGAVFSPDGKKAYVADSRCCIAVYALDAGAGTARVIRKILVGLPANTIAMSADGATVYVGGYNGLAFLDTASDLLTDEVATCSNPTFIALQPRRP